MSMRRLRFITIVGPVGFLTIVELISLFVLRPVLGENAIVRLLIVFAVLALAAVPFAFWVFSIIERQERDLEESAELLDNVRDYAIFMLAPDGTVVTWSAGAERVKGFTAEEVVGKNFSIFYPPEALEAGEPEILLTRAASEGRIEIEGWRVRKDSSRFWANVVSTAVRNSDGSVEGLTHVARDMTERKLAEERIHTLADQLSQRVEELDAANVTIARHNRQLDAVNTAIRSISSAIDLEQVLQNITDAACGLVNARYAALGVADAGGRIATFITSGISAEQREAIGPLPVGHGLLGVLIREGTPLRIADLSRHPASHGFPPNHPRMTSLLGVPILFKGKAIGDLYLTDKIGAPEFSREDEDLLMLLAGHAAVAIENARLYEDARTARDRLITWNERLESIVAERTRQIEHHNKEMTTRVLRAQEEERKRIARELHDETAQSLSTLLITLDLYESALPEDNAALRKGFERVRELARRTLDETRALSHDLRPTILDDVGLAAALQWYADEHQKTWGVPVDVDTESMEDVTLTPELEIALFRIAQEALNNSGKYAHAKHARVALHFAGRTATLIIEDDGSGFDASVMARPTKSSGLGLYGMKERAALLDGDLHIESVPGRGTRITATIPLDESGGADWDLQHAGAERENGK